MCAGARSVMFLNVHIPKAAGSSSECTLSADMQSLPGMKTSKSVWPFPTELAAAARSGVEFREIGNHYTYEDFLRALPAAPASVRAAYPLGQCTGELWSPGGASCSRNESAAQRLCTPLVTWLNHPAKRYVSSFFEHYGEGPRKGTHPTEVERRYDQGRITPDELARWPVASDLRHFLYDNPDRPRWPTLWNHMTQYVGDTRYFSKKRPASRLGVSPDSLNGRAMLELAKRRLDAMDFVGIASRFKDSMTLLSWWLGLPPRAFMWDQTRLQPIPNAASRSHLTYRGSERDLLRQYREEAGMARRPAFERHRRVPRPLRRGTPRLSNASHPLPLEPPVTPASQRRLAGPQGSRAAERSGHGAVRARGAAVRQALAPDAEGGAGAHRRRPLQLPRLGAAAMPPEHASNLAVLHASGSLRHVLHQPCH